jgi:hypothetical protein
MTIHEMTQILSLNGYENFIISTSSEKPGMVTIETDYDSYRISDLLEPYRPIGVQFVYIGKSCFCFGPPAKNCPKHGDVI